MSPRVANMAAFKGSRIGILTVPRQRIEITTDSVALQKALTDKPKPFETCDAYCMAACVAVGLGVMAMAWVGWLP